MHQMYLGGSRGKMLGRFQGSAQQAVEIPYELGGHQAEHLGIVGGACANALASRVLWGDIERILVIKEMPSRGCSYPPACGVGKTESANMIHSKAL